MHVHASHAGVLGAFSCMSPAKHPSGKCRTPANHAPATAVIGRETRRQCLEKWGGKPDIVMACVGGGSNAIGIFNEFVDDEDVGGCCPPAACLLHCAMPMATC